MVIVSDLTKKLIKFYDDIYMLLVNHIIYFTLIFLLKCVNYSEILLWQPTRYIFLIVVKFEDKAILNFNNANFLTV